MMTADRISCYPPSIADHTTCNFSATIQNAYAGQTHVLLINMLISKDEAKEFEEKPRTPKNSRPASVAQQISDIANVDPFIKQVIGLNLQTHTYIEGRRADTIL